MGASPIFNLDQVVGNPDFKSLDLQGKNAFLMQHVPEFASAQPKDRDDLLNVIHYGAPPSPKPAPDTSSILGGIGSEIEDVGKTYGHALADWRTYLQPGRPAQILYETAIKPQAQAIGTAIHDVERRPMSLLTPTPTEALHQAEAVVPIFGPMAARLGAISGAGRTREAIGRGLVDVGGLAAGGAAERLGIGAPESMAEQEASALKTIKEGLKGGRDVEQNIQRAVPYLREVGRAQPKTIDEFHQAVDQQRASLGQQLAAQAERHPEVRIAGDKVADAVAGSVTDTDRELFPEMVKQIETEAARYRGKELTAPQAVEAARNLRAMKRSYFNALPADQAAAENASGSVRAIDRAHDAIVNQLAERLEATGEQNVKGLRADYGAMRKLTDASYNAKVKAGMRPKPSLVGSIMQAAVHHPYLPAAAIGEFGRGWPLESAATAAMVPAIGIGQYLRATSLSPESTLLRGVTKLGKLPGEIPDYGPTAPRVAGLLNAPALTTPVPADTSFVRGVAGQPEAPEAVRFGRLLGAGHPPIEAGPSPLGPSVRDIPPEPLLYPTSRAMRRGLMLPQGEGTGPLVMQPSPLSPLAGSEPTPTGGARGYTTEPQPKLGKRGVSVSVEEPETVIMRNPKTGRMGRQYLGTSKKKE